MRGMNAFEGIVAKLEAGWNAGDGNAFAAGHAALEVPAGPLAGPHTARFSLVLTRDAGTWEIASLHNTREPRARET